MHNMDNIAQHDELQRLTSGMLGPLTSKRGKRNQHAKLLQQSTLGLSLYLMGLVMLLFLMCYFIYLANDYKHWQLLKCYLIVIGWITCDSYMLHAQY